jgi:hypothetical protein
VRSLSVSLSNVWWRWWEWEVGKILERAAGLGVGWECETVSVRRNEQRGKEEGHVGGLMRK